MAYADAADMQLRFDVRTLVELVSDTDAAIDTADLATDTKLAAALDDASGVIDAELLTGGRYSTADLAGLTGTSLALLKRLTCVLAMDFLRQRRPGRFPVDLQQSEADQKWANERLELLRRGVNVFGLDEAIAAGNVAREPLTPTHVQTASLIRDQTQNFYPHRVYAGR